MDSPMRVPASAPRVNQTVGVSTTKPLYTRIKNKTGAVEDTTSSDIRITVTKTLLACVSENEEAFFSENEEEFFSEGASEYQEAIEQRRLVIVKQGERKMKYIMMAVSSGIFYLTYIGVLVVLFRSVVCNAGLCE
jgi:hypothetical protein